MPNLWNVPQGDLHRDRLWKEGTNLSNQHSLPLSRNEWEENA